MGVFKKNKILNPIYLNNEKYKNINNINNSFF